MALRIPPYLFGQCAFAAGAAALALSVFPPMMAERETDSMLFNSQEKAILSNDEAWNATIRNCRIVSIVLATIGLILAPIGWFREKPPLLPVVGACLCLMALLWYYILLATLTVVILLCICIWLMYP